ncbi:hypothetical protein K502DRAFT_329564 [Neoconidiobolus thromboides FSU 785]|nr:hypothetical protein K502DRAFT_329564 [Neoconidiobolus thromboides FSU 785]
MIYLSFVINVLFYFIIAILTQSKPSIKNILLDSIITILFLPIYCIILPLLSIFNIDELYSKYFLNSIYPNYELSSIQNENQQQRQQQHDSNRSKLDPKVFVNTDSWHTTNLTNDNLKIMSSSTTNNNIINNNNNNNNQFTPSSHSNNTYLRNLSMPSNTLHDQSSNLINNLSLEENTTITNNSYQMDPILNRCRLEMDQNQNPFYMSIERQTLEIQLPQKTLTSWLLFQLNYQVNSINNININNSNNNSNNNREIQDTIDIIEDYNNSNELILSPSSSNALPDNYYYQASVQHKLEREIQYENQQQQQEQQLKEEKIKLSKYPEIQVASSPNNYAEFEDSIIRNSINTQLRQPSEVGRKMIDLENEANKIYSSLSIRNLLNDINEQENFETEINNQSNFSENQDVEVESVLDNYLVFKPGKVETKEINQIHTNPFNSKSNSSPETTGKLTQSLPDSVGDTNFPTNEGLNDTQMTNDTQITNESNYVLSPKYKYNSALLDSNTSSLIP